MGVQVAEFGTALRFSLRERRLQSAQLGIPIQHILERGTRIGGRFLRHVCQHQVSGQTNSASLHSKLAENQAEQARLARAIGAGQAQLLSRVNGKGNGGEQDISAAKQTDVVEGQHGRAV